MAVYVLHQELHIQSQQIDQLERFDNGLKDEIAIFQTIQQSKIFKQFMENYIEIKMIYYLETARISFGVCLIRVLPCMTTIAYSKEKMDLDNFYCLFK